MTALELLADKGNCATTICDRARAARKEAGKRENYDGESYWNGQAIAFIDAEKLMKAELRRLCNLFQNGSLTVADFGVVL